MDVGIVGGSGYAGGELVRLLAAHPSFTLRRIAGASSAGRRWAEVFPQAAGTLPDEAVVAASPDALADLDAVFLATPAEASLALAPALVERGVLVLDLSAAFRLPADTFAEWYGVAHTAPHLAPAAYALPELFRGRIRATGQRSSRRLLAIPGCYPTAAALACKPVAGLLDPTTVVVTGLSGTSGAGRKLREDLQASHAAGNAAPYGAPNHRHTPEIEQTLAELTGAPPAPLSFTPHLLPTARGLLCTVVAGLREDVGAEDVRAALHAAYADEPFVHVLDDGWPATAHVTGGNAAHVAARVDARTRRVVVACALDNLLKGAAGQAVQAANLACDLPEATGLSAIGVYP